MNVSKVLTAPAADCNAKDDMFWPLCVCLSVWLSVCLSAG